MCEARGQRVNNLPLLLLSRSRIPRTLLFYLLEYIYEYHHGSYVIRIESTVYNDNEDERDTKQGRQ